MNVGMAAWGAIVDEILNFSDKNFSRVNEGLVNTKFNLNFNVFCDICRVCGVDETQFVSKQTFIDLILLKRRNSIAHGEETLIGPDELDTVADETISLMRSFSNALQNHAILKTYRASGVIAALGGL